jgi:hypothetical protein
LQRAVEEAQQRRRLALEAAGENAERWLWRWAWLPLADNLHGGAIVVDGRTSRHTPATPVYNIEPELGTREDHPRAASLGQMVRWWIEAMDQHLIDYDSATPTTGSTQNASAPGSSRCPEPTLGCTDYDPARDRSTPLQRRSWGVGSYAVTISCPAAQVALHSKAKTLAHLGA